MKTGYGRNAPPPSATIAMGHPLARGLIGAYIVRGRGGQLIRDYVRGRDAVSSSVPTMSAFGGKAIYIATLGHQFPLFSQTLIGVSTSTITSTSLADVGDNGATHDRTLSINGSGQFNHYVFDGGVKNATGTTVVVANTRYAVTGKTDGTNNTIHVNGIREGATAATGGYTSFSAPKQAFGGDLGGGGGNFIVEAFFVHSRGLLDSEIAWLHREPYAMFQYEPVRYYSIGGAATVYSRYYYDLLPMHTGSPF